MERAEELRIRTAVPADLAELRRVYRAASLSNEDDAPLLLANPEFLVFAGDGVADARTRVAIEPSRPETVLGFASVVDQEGVRELDDLFVDPSCRRRGIARRLVLDAVRTARDQGHAQLFVAANPHALAFYQAVGFAEIGRISTELGSGHRMTLGTAARGG